MFLFSFGYRNIRLCTNIKFIIIIEFLVSHKQLLGFYMRQSCVFLPSYIAHVVTNFSLCFTVNERVKTVSYFRVLPIGDIDKKNFKLSSKISCVNSREHL